MNAVESKKSQAWPTLNIYRAGMFGYAYNPTSRQRLRIRFTTRNTKRTVETWQTSSNQCLTANELARRMIGRMG